MKRYKSTLEKLISGSGIVINGGNPFDIQIHNPKTYQRILSEGSIGLGESYMEKWWDCAALDVFFHKLFLSGIENKVSKNWRTLYFFAKAKLFNFQTKAKAKKSISHHYDIGNDLYEKMLDPLMQYSGGYWKNATNLAGAQEQKLKMICEKLHLKPGQKLLDIGCGWGGLAFYAAKNYGAKVVGITLSREQKKLAEKRCENLDVEIRFQDYRDLNEEFDKIVSVGMLEHVGAKNYAKYMSVIERNLKNDGICLLSFIGGNKTGTHTDPWIHRYIFPNGTIPSLAQIGKAFEGKLILQNLENIGLHYDKTIMAWQNKFNASWNDLSEKYGETFYRMWNFYLACSAASFRAQRLHLWQMGFVKPGLDKMYFSERI